MPNGHPKPISLVKGHRSKKEIAQRENAEAQLLTGEKMKPWDETKGNAIAYKYWKRLCPLFASIEKDDALMEPVLNRYCAILAECEQSQTEEKQLREMQVDLDNHKSEMELDAYLTHYLSISRQIATVQSKLDGKRRMLLAIEKDNLMTLVSQMRSIPKKVEEKKAEGIAAYRQRKVK